MAFELCSNNLRTRSSGTMANEDESMNYREKSSAGWIFKLFRVAEITTSVDERSTTAGPGRRRDRRRSIIRDRSARDRDAWALARPLALNDIPSQGEFNVWHSNFQPEIINIPV